MDSEAAVAAADNGIVDAATLDLLARLADRDRRAETARAIAARLGGTDLSVFLHDAEVDALLPAPGFPQTLPGSRAWRQLLARCMAAGEHQGEVLWHGEPGEAPVTIAAACVAQDYAVLLVTGGAPRLSALSRVRPVIPLLAAMLRGERASHYAETDARLARETAMQAARLTAALDASRADLQDALRQAEEARAALQARQWDLERANELLEAQGRELGLKHRELHHQTTELEMTGAELHAANAALAARTEEAERARAEAEHANRAKSEFLAVMSHELRTPLNAIAGYVQLLEMELHGPITGAQREALARIDRSQGHLQRLINDVLNLARIEAGRVQYAAHDVLLADAVAAVRPMIEPQVAAKGLAFEVRVAPDLAARADREKVQQILLNLLTNAIKFTPGGGRVTVDTARRAEVSNTVFVRVSDTGIGVPADKLEAVFEPFMQVDASHTRGAEGSGLGLAISRDFARGMGGDLRVRSAYGQGSTFTLSLPAALADVSGGDH